MFELHSNLYKQLQDTVDEFYIHTLTDIVIDNPEQSLAFLKKENKALKADLNKEKLKTSVINIAKTPSESNLSLALISTFINKQTSVQNIFNFFVEAYPDLFILSDSCLKSLQEFKSFERQEKLFYLLSQVVSTDFLQDFNKKGSIVAYEYFTKSELAFSES